MICTLGAVQPKQFFLTLLGAKERLSCTTLNVELRVGLLEDYTEEQVVVAETYGRLAC